MSPDVRLIKTEAALLALVNSPEWDTTTCWGYTRVSGKKQNRDGLGLEGQRQAIVDYCAARGLTPPVIIAETGSAAKGLLNVQLPGTAMVEGDGSDVRPMFTALLAALTERGAGKHIVFWKLDRFSRADSMEQEVLLRMLWQAGVTIHSTWTAEESVLSGDGLDPSRTLMRQVLQAVSQYERYLILARTRMGMRAKAAKGKHIYPTAPPGYKVVKRDLQIDPTQTLLVCATHYLRRLDFSVRQIQDELHQRFGLGRVTHSRVHRILGYRELYLGTYTDPYGVRHARPELRILPSDLDAWGAENDPHYAGTLR